MTENKSAPTVEPAVDGSTDSRRRPWLEPTVCALPELTHLTLQSVGGGAAGDAVTGSGGSGGLVF